MDARFYIPKKLAGLVNIIWEQRASEPMRWMFLPTGAVELIFRIGPALEFIDGESLSTEVNPTRNLSFLSGLHTRPFKVKFTRFHFIGVQLNPIAVNALFGVPCSVVRDWALDGEHLLADYSDEEIAEKLRKETPFHEKARWLEEVIVRRLVDACDLPFAQKLTNAVSRYLDKPQKYKKTSIEELTGYSRTHTYRLFKKWFGVSPAECIKLYRHIRTLNHLHNTDEQFRLTDVAYEHGYYDQAHFIHTFKEYTGMTPGEYQKEKSDLPNQLAW